MGRNYLKGRDGDRINAVLAAAGYNFGLLLRWLERLLCALLRALLVGLLKWLDEPVQQNPVKTPIAKANAEPVPWYAPANAGHWRSGTRLPPRLAHPCRRDRAAPLRARHGVSPRAGQSAPGQ